MWASVRLSERYLWLVLDEAIVVLFVAIGRSHHHAGLSLAGMASTTWPFAVAVVVAGLVLWGRARAVSPWASGGFVAVVTVAVGMVLRVVSGQGTALAFIVVALAFNGALMIALRAVVGYVRKRARAQKH